VTKKKPTAINNYRQSTYKWSGVDLNHRHTDFQSVAQKSQPPQHKQLTETTQGTGAPYGALSLQNDPDLVLLNKAWPTLPKHIRAAIRAVIDSHHEHTLKPPRKDNDND
jgi:hypothetical protein